jgi:UPF0271 protein
MNTIDLNCDMGEGFNTDSQIMPFISSANIACGFHAGDEAIMHNTVRLAIQHRVAIGAHPGFADKKNFGRTEIYLPLEEVYALVRTQIMLLQKIASANGAKLHHVKPHGALYNMSAKDPALANVIAKAVFDTDNTLLLYGLSGSYSIHEAKKMGLSTASEVFADRTYQNNGSLTPRSQQNAFITNESASIAQVLQMIQQQTVTSVDDQKVPIVAETLCLHGDGIAAEAFAKAIQMSLQENHITIQSIQT